MSLIVWAKGDNGMSRKIKNISNERFGRLVAIKHTEKRYRDGEVIWECVCDCGNITEVPLHHLRAGNVRSCGCLQNESAKLAAQSQRFEGTKIPSLTRKISSNNKSGVKGVHKVGNKWRAQITFQRKVMYLGCFNKIEDAALARKKAEEEYFYPTLEKYNSEANNE